MPSPCSKIIDAGRGVVATEERPSGVPAQYRGVWTLCVTGCGPCRTSSNTPYSRALGVRVHGQKVYRGTSGPKVGVEFFIFLLLLFFETRIVV